MSTITMNSSSILSNLSVEQVKNVVNAKSKEEATYTGLWEKIVNYFCGSKSEWAKEALYNLVHSESIPAVQVSNSYFAQQGNNIENLQRFALLMNLADEDKRQDFSVKFTGSSSNNGKYDLSLYIGEHKIRPLEINYYTFDIEHIEKEGPIIAATYNGILQIFSKTLGSNEFQDNKNVADDNYREILKQPMSDFVQSLREKAGGLALYGQLYEASEADSLKYFTDKYKVISQILHSVQAGDTTLGKILDIRDVGVWSTEIY